MNLPFLSAPDPVTSAEGTLDPLELYPIANALGVKLIPGIRERMSHPRFLTLMAASAAVCQKFDSDEIAKDGVSEPWQVFEWHVVEGLVRGIKEDDRLTGLPGQDKVRAAILDGVPLSARRYLKTPKVFGFHGVYRLLARTTDVEGDGILGESGYRLLEVWREEQGLPGFLESSHGKGSEFLSFLRNAVRDGLAAGQVTKGPSWQGWRMIADSMAPLEPGLKESEQLREILIKPENGHTAEIVRFLLAPETKPILEIIDQRDQDDKVWSERPFHEKVLRSCSQAVRRILEGVLIYERFARLLQDAFDECLKNLSVRKSRTQARMLADNDLVGRARKEIPELYQQVLDSLEPVGLDHRFNEVFGVFSEKLPETAWVEQLIEHHRKVQRQKPPAGKLPWIEQFDDGSYIIRTAFLREEGGQGDDGYVHAYRLSPLRSFIRDLRIA